MRIQMGASVNEESFRLADEHLARAKEIAGRHCRRSGCRACHGRGWTGTAQDNTIVLCHKCVSAEAAFADWKEYVGGIPALREHYKELFEQPAPAGAAQEARP
jgi:hypothetical protein